MDIQDYLTRIQVDRAEAPSLDFLAHLQEQHLLAVPFENLDVVAGREILLAEPNLFEKVVRQRRGGFCYELNGLFCWLLRALGFSVTRVSARVYNDEGLPGPEFDHMALLVHLDQTYLVDVGFGDSALRPIPLPDGHVNDRSGHYRLAPAPGKGLALERQAGNGAGWQAVFLFSLTPRQLAEYRPMCVYHQTSTASQFTQAPLCTRATPTGRLTLSPDTLTITTGTENRKLPVPSPDAYFDLLQGHFAISLSPALRRAIRLA